MEKTPSPGGTRLRWNQTQVLGWSFLAVSLLFSLYVRLRLSALPLDRDEGEYAYAGKLILQGIPPYQLAYNMKLPGTYLAYAALMALFGQTAAGIHLGLAFVNLLTLLTLFLMVRDLFGPLEAGLSCLALAVLSESPSVFGMSAHATHFVVLFGLPGTWLLWRAGRSGKWVLWGAGGLFLGLAFLMKQQGLFLPLFGAAMALQGAKGPGTSSWRPRAVPLGATLAGIILPYLATCLWLGKAGVLDRFWFWTVQYAREYVTEVPLGEGLLSFFPKVRYIVVFNWPLWFLALLGILAFSAAKERRKEGLAVFVWGFTLSSLLCVFPGFYFRGHYFIPFLPALALWSGVGGGALWRWGRTSLPGMGANPSAGPASPGLRLFSRLLLAGAVLWPIWCQRLPFFQWSPDQVSREVYPNNAFPEFPVVADYIRSNSKPGERLAVLGSEPELYFYSDRLSATGYIYTYGLMEPQPYASRMQREMAEEIGSSNPEFIVWVNVMQSWTPHPHFDPFLFQWKDRYLAAHYRRVGVVDLLSQGQTVYQWGRDSEGYNPRSPNYLLVYRREPSPAP